MRVKTRVVDSKHIGQMLKSNFYGFSGGEKITQLNYDKSREITNQAFSYEGLSRTYPNLPYGIRARQ